MRVEHSLRARRRQRAARALGIVMVALVVAGGAALFFFRPATPAQGHQVPIEGNRQHVAQGADMAYRNRPPSSGDHYPTPAGYGVFGREIALGNLVHALEHGGIVVYYRPDLCDQGCQDQLRKAYSGAPRSRQYGVVKMVVAPWEDMDHAVTSAAWGRVDEMDQADPDRILAFYREHVDHGPEDAL
jgi:uncharacterized protein DUF3105